MNKSKFITFYTRRLIFISREKFNDNNQDQNGFRVLLNTCARFGVPYSQIGKNTSMSHTIYKLSGHIEIHFAIGHKLLYWTLNSVVARPCLPGWGESPTQRTKMRKKMSKVWGNKKDWPRFEEKNEGSGTLAHGTVTVRLQPWPWIQTSLSLKLEIVFN